MHIPTFVFIFILFLKKILLLLLYPTHVIKPLGYNLGCYNAILLKHRSTLFIVDPSTPYCAFAYMKTESLQDKFTLYQAC